MNTKILLSVCVIVLIAITGYTFAFAHKTPSSSTSTQSVKKGYALSDVATHKDASSCWSAINGKVYDLTSWINQHPGGPDNILRICGIDGSAAFNNQHGGQRRPEEELTNFYIGELSQ